MDSFLAKTVFGSYSLSMNNATSRKFIRTKYEGVFYRVSAKRDPVSGEFDKVYCFRYVDPEGKDHWKTVGRHSKGIRATTARKARSQFLAEMEATGVNPVERDKVTVGDAIDAYVAWGHSEGKYVDQHYSQYRAHLADAVRDLPIADLNSNLLSQIKAKLLEMPTCNTKAKNARKVRSTPLRKCLAGATVNNIFSFMRSAINRAIAIGMWKGVNPLSTKGGNWKMVKVNNKRLRFLTREEAKALLADLEARHPQLHDMVLLSLKTGLRPTEMFRLKGQDIDANARVLHIIAKGGKRTPVRVPQDMIEMLLAYRRKPQEPIFQQPRKKVAFTKTPACLRTAIRDLKMEPQDGDPLYTITLHTMRHTFASWLAQSGEVSLMELQKLMRHESINMTMRYAHLIPGHESEKLAVIERFLS